jgi:hypothetical protein
LQSVASLYSQHAHASGYFAAGGDAQGTIQLVARCTTAGGGAATELFLDGAAATQRMVIPARSAWTFDILVVGISQNSADYAGFRAYGLIERDNANVTTLYSTTGVITEIASGGQAVAIAGDNVNEALVITFNDNSTAAHRVVATIRMAQVTFP